MDIVINDAALAALPGDGFFEISDGWFEVGNQLHENMIPFSLDVTANVRGHIVLVNGETIDLSGHSLTVRPVGESEFIERLPSEWAPN